MYGERTLGKLPIQPGPRYKPKNPDDYETGDNSDGLCHALQWKDYLLIALADYTTALPALGASGYLTSPFPTRWLTSWLFSAQMYSMISVFTSMGECPSSVKGRV